jgi:hypothetical protein
MDLPAKPAKSTMTRPLSQASQRLRRRPGRPRKNPVGDIQADSAAVPATHVRTIAAQRADLMGAAQGRALSADDTSDICGAAVPALCPLTPRLMNVSTAALYLGVSPWTVRDLEAAGVLRRVRVPLPGRRELRRLLFDKDDLDHLVAAWKDPAR